MRIWIYGRDQTAVRALRAERQPADVVIGTSVFPAQGTNFPLGGLTPAMYAAIRGELDLLFVSDRQLLGDTPQQIREMETEFQRYGVSVKSASSNGSSSS